MANDQTTTTSAPPAGNMAFVTLVTSDPYVLGALVLAQSLRASNTLHPSVVMYTSQVTPSMVDLLRNEFSTLVLIDVLRSADYANLNLLQRPDLDVSFSKLHAWTLVQFDKLVFLDADTLIVQNIDDLFERDEISAAPDCGWPDIFNSGVFVLKPNMNTYERLIAFAGSRGSWDGGDQGLLNEFFSDWNMTPGRRLPFVYNVTPTSVYTYAPAFERFQSDIKVIHFAGPNKPWTYSRTTDGSPMCKSSTPSGSVLYELVTKWWTMFGTRESSWGYLFARQDQMITSQTQHQEHHHQFSTVPSLSHATEQGSGGWVPGYVQIAPMIDINNARYSWPEHEFDTAELENWKISMSGRRGSFPRRRSSITQDIKLSPTAAVGPNFETEPVLPLQAAPVHLSAEPTEIVRPIPVLANKMPVNKPVVQFIPASANGKPSASSSLAKVLKTPVPAAISKEKPSNLPIDDPTVPLISHTLRETDQLITARRSRSSSPSRTGSPCAKVFPFDDSFGRSSPRSGSKKISVASSSPFPSSGNFGPIVAILAIAVGVAYSFSYSSF